MRINLADAWRFRGEISRSRFIVWALVLFGIKYNFDRILLAVVFGEQWTLLNYFRRPLPWIGRSPVEAPFEYGLLLALSLPFLYAGLALSLKRLRSARLPLWLVALFVVPVLKWFLFLALTIVPGRENGGKQPGASAGRLSGWLPKTALGSAFLAVVASGLLAVAAVYFGATLLKDYAWGLFAGVPFCMGFLSVLVFGAERPRSLRDAIGVALLSVALSGLGLLLFAAEGLICIVMAAPLALVLSTLGALVGYTVQVVQGRDIPQHIFCLPVLAVPVMFGGDYLSREAPELLKVTTAIEIQAKPERVWQNVVSFSELPPPTERIFKLGIAYPVRAEILGHGPGAVRHCIFSTGPFVEPIKIWDEPTLLRFSVTKNPAPMTELTPYQEIHPPHLEGFLISKQGEFRLEALPGGRTLLRGTTWYHHSLWPARYWQLWSDYIIHTIHLRVLNHVKRLSEGRTDVVMAEQPGEPFTFSGGEEREFTAGRKSDYGKGVSQMPGYP